MLRMASIMPDRCRSRVCGQFVVKPPGPEGRVGVGQTMPVQFDGGVGVRVGAMVGGGVGVEVGIEVGVEAEDACTVTAISIMPASLEMRTNPSVTESPASSTVTVSAASPSSSSPLDDDTAIHPDEGRTLNCSGEPQPSPRSETV
jgi:hypothetical protein